jgi:peptidoglycan/xylan/chitin deacetylase (PgdA/CDA1 family)
MAAPQRAELLARAATEAGVDLHAVLADTMLTWEQIRELHAAGWVIGAHTVSHSNVALIAPEEAEREMLGSRDALAAAIGAPVRHFCYPNTGGRHQYFSPDTGTVLRRLGFRSAATSMAGALRPDVDRFALPRLGVSPRLGPVSALAVALERQRLAA